MADNITKGTKDISVAQRQVFILSLLSDNPLGFTVDEITDRLNNWGADVKKRTVGRDIDELSVSYAIVEYEQNGKTYYKANKFNMKNVDLTGLDMLSISFLQKILVPYEGYSIGKNAKKILDKMTDNTGKLNRKLIDELGRQLIVEDSKSVEEVISPEIEKLLKAAIDKRNVVMIDYLNWKSNEVTKRVIHPLTFKIINKRMSIEAFCEMRNDIRTFRLSRIKKAQVLSRTFEIPKGYDKEGGNQFMYLDGKDAREIKIKFTADAAKFVKEYKADIADRLEEKGDEVIFSKRAAITPEVVQFVLSFGSGATVIEPEELKVRVEKEICAMYEKLSR